MGSDSHVILIRFGCPVIDRQGDELIFNELFNPSLDNVAPGLHHIYYQMIHTLFL